MNRLFYKMRLIFACIAVVVAVFLSSCSSSKKAIEPTVTLPTQGTPTEFNVEKAALQVLQTRLSDKNITADANITIIYGDNEVSAPGSLHLRQNEMIRLQVFVPILGTEVGRIEFTPTTVTIIDRMHKQYVKESYDKVDFLAENGLSFYNLQALFWNSLFVPGQKNVDKGSIKQFKLSSDKTGSLLQMTIDKGALSYKWTAQPTNGLIKTANIGYQDSGTKAQLSWTYDKFKSLGVGQYPSLQTICVTAGAASKQKKVTMTLKLSSIDNSSKWNTTTEISKKYKQVSASDALRKLFGK